jgi:hypothetical protein
LTPELAEVLADGIQTEAKGRDVQRVAAERNALIVNILRGARGLRDEDE